MDKGTRLVLTQAQQKGHTAFVVTLALILGSLTYLIFLTAVEGYTVWAKQPTISKRLQGFASKNVQIAVLAALVVGWLAAHFTGYPG
jgi:hypothetical protein